MVVKELEGSVSFERTSVCNFQWSLEKYSVSVVYKETFAITNGSKLLVELRPNHNYGGNYHIQPFLRLEGHEGADSVEVSIKHANGSSFVYSDVNAMSKGDLVTDVNKPFFYQRYANSTYLSNGCLDLIVSITVRKKVSSETLETNMKDQNGKLYKDMKAILDSKAVSDFTYRVDGRDFPVHKMMLAARSSVYLKMFSTDYKTSTEGIIDNTSAEAFEEFIRFIYTGEVKDLPTHAKDLLKIADKYEVDDLKTICELYLLSNLTEDVAADLFLTAHEFRCSADLKKASFEYIKNSFAEWNLPLHDDFIEAPETISMMIMMRKNLKDKMKIENVQAEKVRKAATLKIGEPEEKTESQQPVLS